MKILAAGEQFGVARLDPRGARQRLAARTVAIRTRVVPDARVPALVALLDMPAERGRPTLLNRRHDAPLRGRQRRNGVVTIAIAVAAKHIRHSQRRTTHRRTA